TGPLAFVNPFLFSTKFYDWETGLLYYGHRCYGPSIGRWLSRDPVLDRASALTQRGAGANSPPGGWRKQSAYAVCENNLISFSDYLGLFQCPSSEGGVPWVGTTTINGDIQCLYWMC